MTQIKLYSTRTKVDLFQAPNPMEFVSYLNVYDYGPASNPYRTLPEIVRLAHVLLPGCLKNDIIQVGCNFQCTNDLSYAVELLGRLILTQSATDLDGISLSGRSGTGYNITPDMHHGDQHLISMHKIPNDGDWWVALILYAGGSSLTKPGDVLKVDVGYGDLDVLRIRA